MVLALLLAAAAHKPPPAKLVIPESMRRKRSGEDLYLPPSLFDDPRVSVALGPLHPQAGAWAEYAIHSTGAGGVRTRISILSVLPDGRFWVELNAISEDTPPASVKLLLRGPTMTGKDVERAFVWITGQAPIELPVDQIPPEDPPVKPAPAALKVRRDPPAAVQVPAGAFESAEVLRVGDTRIWRAAKVPLWGLVKAQSPRQTLELTASGATGAHSVFPPGWGDDQGKGSESTK